jgi:hypothetical protein
MKEERLGSESHQQTLTVKSLAIIINILHKTTSSYKDAVSIILPERIAS